MKGRGPPEPPGPLAASATAIACVYCYWRTGWTAVNVAVVAWEVLNALCRLVSKCSLGTVSLVTGSMFSVARGPSGVGEFTLGNPATTENTYKSTCCGKMRHSDPQAFAIPHTDRDPLSSEEKILACG